MAYTTSDNNYGTAKFIVGTSGKANYLTIATALTAASSGDTIFILPGTYTENLTLKAGVNLTAFQCDSSFNGTGHVIISGTCTLTTAGSVTISGIQLQTNSAALLAVTGSAASIVNLFNCYLNCTNNTGITFSSSSGSSAINIKSCSGDLGTTGIALFAHSSSGNLNFYDSDFTNTGGSSSANTVSAGTLTSLRLDIKNPITTSGTGAYNGNWSRIGTNTQNVTALTIGGSGNGTFFFGSLTSGSASACSIGATYNISQCSISSSNTNAITGAGTVNLYGNVYTSTSYKVNTTTQTGGAANGLTQGTAPSVGMVGERIVTVISTASVSMSTATAKTIGSVSLTAGIWDVSGLIIYSGASGAGTICHCSISTTNNTAGTYGDADYYTANGPVSGVADHGVAIPAVRITIASTTTVYLVGVVTISSGTIAAGGRISAVRVG